MFRTTLQFVLFLSIGSYRMVPKKEHKGYEPDDHHLDVHVPVHHKEVDHEEIMAVPGICAHGILRTSGMSPIGRVSGLSKCQYP